MGSHPRVGGAGACGGEGGSGASTSHSGISKLNSRIPGPPSPLKTRTRRLPSARVAESFWVAPPRVTSIATDRPAGVSPTRRASWLALRTASPSKRTITSPSWIPAFSAGLPSSTERTFVPRTSPSVSSRPTPSRLPPAWRTTTRFSTFGPS